MSGWEIILLRPLWLLALLPLTAVGWVLWRRQNALGDWERATDPEMLQALMRLGHVEDTAGQNRPLVLLLIAATVVVLSLCGPALERRGTQSYRNLDGVLFVVDASSSVTDHARWSQMLTMGRFGINALGTRPGGIIVFGGDAYVATDMTLDHLQLGQTFSLIEAGIVPDIGSRPHRALALSAQLLRDADVIAGDVLLFTDGSGLGPASLQATQEIVGHRARLSIVALNASTPEMKAHADLGSGQVFALEDVEGIGRFLSDDARARLERQEFPLLFWYDIGRYMLLLALVPIALLFRRGIA